MTTKYEVKDEGAFVTLYENGQKVLSGSEPEMTHALAMVMCIVQDIEKIEDVTLQDRIRYPFKIGNRFHAEADYIRNGQWNIIILERKPQTQIYQSGRGFGYALNSRDAHAFIKAFMDNINGVSA